MSKGLVVISGASGLVGTALQKLLKDDGYEIGVLSRGKKRGLKGVKEIVWDIPKGEIDAAGLEGCKAVVHLAGKNIGDGYWTKSFKAACRDSRIQGTKLLAEALAGLKDKPEVYVQASAVGLYSDRREELLDEDATPAEDFLGTLCRDWEAAGMPAQRAGIRTVWTRIGVVLSKEGGALGKMLLPFKLCLGGRLGSGDQWMSWVALDDVVRAIHFAIETPELSGPANLASPNPARNREFTAAMGQVLGRPTPFPVPGFVVRTIFGEMGDNLLLGSTRVRPKALLDAGFEFRYPELVPALEAAIA